MKFRIAIDEKNHDVEIRQPVSQTNQPGMTIYIDGKAFTVAVTERDENSGAIKLKVNEKEYKVALGEPNITNGKTLNVRINEAPFEIKVDTLAGTMGSVAGAKTQKMGGDARAEGLEPRTAAKSPIGAGKIIRPPMPGKIISVKVREGDMVKSGDVVLILEAMKMANEIITPYTGKVREVRVSAGQSVAPEDVVISIE